MMTQECIQCLHMDLDTQKHVFIYINIHFLFIFMYPHVFFWHIYIVCCDSEGLFLFCPAGGAAASNSDVDGQI